MTTEADLVVDNVSEVQNPYVSDPTPDEDGRVHVRVHEVVRVRVKPGDLIIAKLGDPNTGWIPAPEHEKHLKDLFVAAFKELGIENVAVLVYHYGLSLEILETGVPDPTKNAATVFADKLKQMNISADVLEQALSLLRYEERLEAEQEQT